MEGVERGDVRLCTLFFGLLCHREDVCFRIHRNEEVEDAIAMRFRCWAHQAGGPLLT